MTNLTEKELLFFLMDQNIMVNGKMEKVKVMEQKHGKMEENIQENLKMINQMEKELLIILMVQVILGSGLTEKNMDQEL